MKDEKKDISLQIFKILKDHSDVNNYLSKKQITSFLQNEYGHRGHIDPRTISDDIAMLNKYLGDAIHCNKSKSAAGNTYYLEREFDESELMLLIDSVLSSKSITDKQCKDLIEKLKNEASSNFDYKGAVIKKYTSGLSNGQLFYSIEIIGEAIEKKVKIKYNYCDYDIDKKLVPRLDNNGKAKVYTLTPLRMVVNNGRYYLFGVPDISNELSIYRIDKIREAEILDEVGKPRNEIKGLKDGMELGKHIAEHIFMTLGPSETIIFEFNKQWVSSVIDWFGKDIAITKKDSNTYIGSIKVNVKAFINWLMMCSFTGAKVTSPKSVIEAVKERVKEINAIHDYK